MNFLLKAPVFHVRLVSLLAGMMMPAHAAPEAVPVKKANLEQLTKIPASEFVKIVDRSHSPDKRLAVGVGSLDGSKPKWEKVPEGEEDATSVLVNVDDCGNYLIDVGANRVTGILDAKHFGTAHRYNHESAAFVWSADSRWLVEVQSWKWETAVCVAHRVSPEGKLLAHLDFKALAEGIVQEQLRKQSPKLSAEVRRQYVVTIEAPTLSNEGILTTKVLADIPKNLESKPVNLSVVVKLEEAKTGDLSAKVIKVDPVKVDEAE
jgi:hypothetical protein